MQRIFILTVSIIAAAFFLYYQNNYIGVSSIDLKLERLPQDFDGFKVVHLSDLHSKVFGENQHTLVSKIKDAEPDIILLTGDMVDSKRYEEEPVLKLVDVMTGIAPIYYVTGNHESISGRFSSLERRLKERGVLLLRNKIDSIMKGESRIYIVGIDDPEFENKLYYSDEGTVSSSLQKALEGSAKQSFKILLAHRPELLSTYAGQNINLIFSGHAHGGQVRLPFIGGIITPNQGFFPKYTSGIYNERNSVMIVNRGLGNSIIPQRIFNRPEIIVVRLGVL